MNEVRDILAKALPDTPPTSAISRDGIIAAGRRAKFRRNWLATTAAGVSTLVVGAGIAGGITWGQRPSGSTIDIGSTPSVTWSASPTPSMGTPTPTVTQSGEPPPSPGASVSADPNDAGPPASVRNVKPALTAAFRAALAQVAPDATAKKVTEAFGGADIEPFEVVKSQGGYKTWAEVNDSKGKSTLFAYMQVVSFDEVSSRFSGACSTVPPGMFCSTRVGTGGELIWIQQGKPNGGSITQYNVAVTRPNGSSIDVVFDNYSYSDQSPANPQPQRATPTLSVDQLVELLLYPGVTIV